MFRTTCGGMLLSGRRLRQRPPQMSALWCVLCCPNFCPLFNPTHDRHSSPGNTGTKKVWDYWKGMRDALKWWQPLVKAQLPHLYARLNRNIEQASKPQTHMSVYRLLGFRVPSSGQAKHPNPTIPYLYCTWYYILHDITFYPLPDCVCIRALRHRATVGAMTICYTPNWGIPRRLERWRGRLRDALKINYTWNVGCSWNGRWMV